MKKLLPLLVAAPLAAVGVMAHGQQPAAAYDKAPEFALPSATDGKTHALKDFDKKVRIVDFWATWCPPCRQEIPGFIALQKKYADKGLMIVGFSFDYEPTAHEVWIREQGLNYQSIYARTDAGEAVREAFAKQIGEITGLPTTLVIDRQGRIVYKHLGYGPPEEFEKVLVPLL